MIASTSINCLGNNVEFCLDTNKLDRNYDDESYAYWIVNDEFGSVHEVNIYKDQCGFKNMGTVYTWFKKVTFDSGDDPNCVSDVMFLFSDSPNPTNLESMISKAAYKEIETKVGLFVGDAFDYVFPAIVTALEKGDRKVREDILINWLDVNHLRVCTHCGALMEEGWYMGEAGYSCSDKCAAEMEGITMEQFDRYRIYKDDIIGYLEQYGNGKTIEQLTKKECDAIIDQISENLDYYWTEWY